MNSRNYEFEQQCKVIAWCDKRVNQCAALEEIVGSANGEKRETKVNRRGQRYCPAGDRLKRSGVRAGFPDLQLPVQMKIEGIVYGALFIEMKAITFPHNVNDKPLKVKYGVTSAEQTKVQHNLKAFGNFVTTCYSADTINKTHGTQRIQHSGAIDVICGYLGLDRAMMEVGHCYPNWHSDWCKKMGLPLCVAPYFHDKGFNDDIPFGK